MQRILLSGICLGFTAIAAAQTGADAAPAPVTKVLVCEALIDVAQAKPLGPHSIVIEGERITEVLPGRIERAGAQMLEAPAGSTCMPGLIDMHTHLTTQTSPQGYAEGFRLNPADFALRSVGYAQATLMAGFTTVRDLGDRDGLSMALRDAVNQGLVQGPRIYTSGKSIATTGGHADPTNGVSRRLSGDPGPAEGVVNGVEEARKAVRQRYKEGSDLIKITATGGVLSVARSVDNPQFKLDELEAIVATARDYGFTVAAHAHGAEGAKRAILAGVNSIEHGTFMTDEVMRLMKERQVWYVPTISAGVFVGEFARRPGYYPEVVRPKALAVGPLIQKTFTRAFNAGVPIAFGTDAGVFPHGLNAREFVLMVEAGMPPMDALLSATVNAAKLLGASADVGGIAPGFYADIVAVPGDPLADISVMQRLNFVVKGGELVRTPDTVVREVKMP